ncbi:MAG: PD-(D/E)XK nuclease family protein [Bacteroidaceae bacterium]|nr:PD-(D/E)XK nuclease family protein [Bacteroidaceae bacterium]
MTTFLELVAKDLYESLNGDFSNTTIIFPNKRANLFFNSHLTNLSEKPMWTPYYTSISEIFEQLTTRTVCDPIKLVCKLYEAFVKVTGTEESLDKFYSWGEMMLSDFEDIDNNMADAKKLFANISDLEAMTDFSFLSENQVAAIRQFFINFNPENRTRLKDKFLSIWDALLPTYTELNKILKEENLCYEGMMKREIIEQMKSNPEEMLKHLPSENYAIVGFNVLNETERQLFKFLQKNKNTYFYWDYDEAYLDIRMLNTNKPYHGYEAGQFILEDIRTFGNRFSDHPEYYRNFKNKKNITFIASPTENAQTRYVSQWIKDNIHTNEHLSENAIVLCNESIMPPVLHSIPPVLDDNEPMALNVTMGYPLLETPAYSFVQALLELQIHGRADRTFWRYSQVANVLRHPFTRRLTNNESINVLNMLKKSNIMFPSEKNLVKNPTSGYTLTDTEEQANSILAFIFTRQNSQTALLTYISELLKKIGATYRIETNEILQKESIFNAYTTINRIHALQEDITNFNVNDETLYRLIKQIMTSMSIPFHGEPAIGIQVMGILETRNLDFKNIILLSCNEDMLPKNTHKASLIPYNLRQAYGMTTMEKQVSLYAYYFYNLLQRAENITIMYNSSTDGLNKGEMSRFMMQLQIEAQKILGPGQEVIIKNITSDSESERNGEAVITKTSDVMEVLHHRFKDKPLSPTAINTFIKCPMQFYFRYVAGYKEEDEVTEDVDNPMFGNIFHYCMEQIYKDFQGRQVQSTYLKALAEDKKKIAELVDEGFAVKLFNKPEGQVKYINKYNGQQLLNHYVLCKYIKNQLLFDASYCPMKILGVEHFVSNTITLSDGSQVMLGGIIDRFEQLSHEDSSEYIRIVDYKTGAHIENKGKLEDIFNGKSHYMFQAFYYCDILMENYPNSHQICPSLMFVTQPLKAKDPYLTVDNAIIENFADIKDFYHENLIATIESIFNQNLPFNQCSDEKNCEYCTFKNFCKRQ